MFGLSKAVTDIGVMAVVVLLLIVAALFGFKWADTAGALKQETAAHEQTTKALKACDAQLAEASRQVDEQNAKVEAWVDRASQYKRAADEAQAEADKRAKKYLSTIAKLRSVPLPTEQCPQTKAYVQQYLLEERAL